MTVIRPSPVRVGRVALFGCLGLWPVLVASAPLLARITGGVALAAVPLILAVGLRTRVVIGEDVIEARTPFRCASGRRDELRIMVRAIGAGPFGRGEALEVTDADGHGVSLVLSLFSPADRDRLLSVLLPLA